jgi:hypothetical protein
MDSELSIDADKIPQLIEPNLGYHEEILILWERYLQFLQVLVCGRCFRDHFPGTAAGCVPAGHSKGAFMLMLKAGPGKIPAKYVDNYFKDTEHGFFHGVCAGFMLYLRKKTEFDKRETMKQFGDNGPKAEVSQLERELISCILHDFHRAATGEDEKHDANLKLWFTDATEDTYGHSNPCDRFAPVVIADRWELHRFADVLDWINPEYLQGYFNGRTQKLAQYFYTSFRPGLERLYRFRNGRWIRHGVELVKKYDFAKSQHYPQKGAFYNANPEGEPAWSIEFAHMYDPCILDHPKNKAWLTWFGLLPFEKYQQADNPLIPANFESPKVRSQNKKGLGGLRDHMAAFGQFSLSDWVFVTRGLHKRLPPKDPKKAIRQKILRYNDEEKWHPDKIIKHLKIDRNLFNETVNCRRSEPFHHLTLKLLRAGGSIQAYNPTQAFLRITRQMENILYGLRT